LKKKFLFIAIILTVVLFIGCGINNTENSIFSETSEPTPTSTPIPTPESTIEPTVEPAETPSPTAEPTETLAEADFGDHHVKLLGGEISEGDDGYSILTVDYEFTNNSETSVSFAFELQQNLTQDGIKLDRISRFSDYEDIDPDTTVTTQMIFILISDSPVELEVSPMFSFDENDNKMTYTFDFSDLDFEIVTESPTKQMKRYP